MLPIIRGHVPRPQRIVIYTPEGFGKSTLASKLPAPLFLDFENGADHLDVARLKPKTLTDVEAVLASLVKDQQGFGTLIIDTLDWLEELVIIEVCTSGGKKSIEDFGYGKGYVMVAERFNDLLAKINAVATKMNVVCLSHVHVKKFELPDSAGAFDRYELKLSKQVKPLVQEWCDALLFGNWRTKIREVEDGDNTKYKALGGKERLIFAAHTAACDAKNRHSLKDEEPWGVETVLKCFGAAAKVQVTPPAPEAKKPDVAKIASGVKTVATPVVEAVAKVEAAKIETTVTVAEDTIPHLEKLVVESSGEHPLSVIVGANEEHANAYLVSRSVIKSGQTFRDVLPAYVERCKKNPAAWVAQFMRGVAA